MKSTLTGLAAAALLLGSAVPAQAQWFNRNQIVNSGNGAYNAISVRNLAPAPGPPAFAAPAYGPVYGAPAYGPAYAAPAYGPAYGGYGDGGYGDYQSAPRFPVLQGLLQAVGGLNINVIKNSGNGIGNRIFTNNAGRPGGINLNVIKNSGNGANNSVGIGNNRPYYYFGQ